MRFQTTLAQPIVPPPSDAALRAILPIQRTALQRTSSGESSWVIPPGQDQITLYTLIVSWNRVETPGDITIIAFNGQPIFTILQSEGAGKENVECHELPVYLGDWGLRALNNSIGGYYAVTAIYK